VSCCCENQIVENGDLEETQRKVNTHCWEPLANNGSDDVTVDTSVCVTVNYIVQSSAVSEKPINAAINSIYIYIYIYI
jgi:hypothetical protein